ncbi:MAG TPA: hypothetical protein VEL11_05050 [Candidatus Bathyarchaeia archaeon]|nr:hypothetical protein [Candidatus Bathyarchaeia archaeon]
MIVYSRKKLRFAGAASIQREPFFTDMIDFSQQQLAEGLHKKAA